jgi:hypothetical protein
VALLADSEELRDAATLRRTEVKALFEIMVLFRDKQQAKEGTTLAPLPLTFVLTSPTHLPHSKPIARRNPSASTAGSASARAQ